MPWRVKPGDRVTFSFMAAPAPGSYPFHWQMVQDGERGGASTTVSTVSHETSRESPVSQTDEPSSHAMGGVALAWRLRCDTHPSELAGFIATTRLLRTYAAATSVNKGDHLIGTRAFNSSIQCSTT